MNLKCWECQKEIEAARDVEPYFSWRTGQYYDAKFKYRRVYCAECDERVKKQYKSEHEMYISLKSKFMLERAINIIEEQNIDVYEYEEAIKAVSEKLLANPQKFKSAEEVVSAIVLISNRIHIKVNHKVGKYIADILIPSLSCVVEIDGYTHNSEKVSAADGKRDVDMRNMLGREWETVRIPTRFIHQNALKLPDAIIGLKKAMQEQRAKNNGILPDAFAKRFRAHYKKILASGEKT